MTRLTEYHNGVAVIKGKRYKEAAEKLAFIEDYEEASEWEIDPKYRVIRIKEGVGRVRG